MAATVAAAAAAAASTAKEELELAMAVTRFIDSSYSPAQQTP
jgi:hypothetical protein